MFYYDPTYILLIPAIIFTLIAQASVNRAFKRYSRVRNRKNMTGAEAARRMLDFHGLQDVRINSIGGNLSDHYNPKNRTLNLSETVYGVNSVAAVSVACHEAGHALQHAYGYTPLKLRNAIVPAVNLTSTLAWPMIFIGILLLSVGSYEMGYFGMLLLDIGIIGFAAVVVFHAITLPVEFNASRRAIQKMEELGMTLDQVITLASMVQGEASKVDYMKRVSAVFHNRLRSPAIYPKLESDPTRKYADLIAENLPIPDEIMTTAYNTYKGTGLPPGAINNPGREAIEAVLYPVMPCNDYFFNSNIDTGETFFAETYDQHLLNLETVQAQYAAAKAAANGET